MKKIVLLLSLVSCTIGFAQKKTENKQEKTKKDWSKLDFSNRSADHFMLQYGSDTWTGGPDTIRTKGFSRHFNMYFMVDKPFKTNPRFSVGLGAGISSSNIFLDRMSLDLKAAATRLPIRNLADTSHFSKYKLTTIYGEIPVELRYFSNPENPNKSWKAALGVRVGTILRAHTKGKNFVNKAGASIYDNRYIQKEVGRRFMNGTRIALSGRVGYGIFSLHATYQVTTVFKEGLGPEVRPFSLGVTISGL